MSYSVLKNPIFVALDVDDLSHIRHVVKETCDIVGGYKIGPRTVFRYGPSFVQEIAESAPVFLDFKFYDIPSTMESAVLAAYDMGASFCTIHAGCGKRSLLTLANTELELSSQRPFHILGVTILTSFDEDGLPSNFQKKSIVEHVDLLVEEAIENGITNFVCSPMEIKSLKSKYKEARFVTPGIRMDTDAKGDQVRTASFQEAKEWGVSAVVVGRPIVHSENPRQSLLKILAR